MQAAGVSACAKHFPGKGHAPVDAHLGLPVIDSDWGDMHALHLPPFMAAMEAGVDCIMTSHPLYPRLDPAPAMPATFSKLIVEDYLRGQVGYRGVIVSDDLEMGAIGALCPIGEPPCAPRWRSAGLPHRAAARRTALLDAARAPFRGVSRRWSLLDTWRPATRHAWRAPGRKRTKPLACARPRAVTRDTDAPSCAAAERRRGGGIPPIRPRRPDHGGARDAARTVLRRLALGVSPDVSWWAWSPEAGNAAAAGGARGTHRAFPLRRPPLPPNRALLSPAGRRPPRRS
jgi:hypothetical protein